MRAVAAVLVGIAILAAVFGVYRSTRGDDQRDRAEVATNEFAAYFSRTAGASCASSELEPLPDGRWRFHLDCGQGDRCMAVDPATYHLSRKDSMYVGGNVEGVADVRCSEDSWTQQEAAKRLAASPWARQRKARFVSCVPRPSGARSASYRYAPYSNRFGCRYSSPRGDGFVLIHTAGAERFEVESSR